MITPCFFGYGSLVNRATHDYPNAVRARLHGWRRVWRHAEGRPAAFLTAAPAGPADVIAGLVADVPDADWSALDEREAAYDRVSASVHRVEGDASVDIHVYWVPDGKHAAPDRDHPILLSYLDVVTQGYLREYGAVGVEEFFETTDGWHAPVRNDRDAPAYRRHQPTSSDERALVDAYLLKLGATVIG